MITREMLENWFTYHPTTEEQLQKYVDVRNAALVFAQIAVDATPACADQSAGVRSIREAVMTFNAAIACGGK